MLKMKYDISEYRNMLIPKEFRCLMGNVSRDEMQQRISVRDIKNNREVIKV